MASHIILVASLLALASSRALAYDPSPLQDFCVADTNSTLFVNGFVCKNPNLATADDFFFSGLDKPGNISVPGGGASVNEVSVDQVPGLNTFGISLVRIDYEPYGLAPLHIHLRASEIFTVLKGKIKVGFVTSNPANRLFMKTLKKGDVYVFPMGLPHFQLNLGATNAVAIAAFGSQDRGVVFIAKAIFGSNPPIPDSILAKDFKLDKKKINYLQAQFGMGNS